jgi:hypothetical protein
MNSCFETSRYLNLRVSLNKITLRIRFVSQGLPSAVIKCFTTRLALAS